MQSILKEIVLSNIIINNNNYPDYDLDCCKCLLKTSIRCILDFASQVECMHQDEKYLFVKNRIFEITP